MDNIKVVAFDADDTLWENQTYYDEAEKRLGEILQEYGDPETVLKDLFSIEMANMQIFGYGAMAFTLSMIETALKVSNDTIPAAKIHEIHSLGKSLLHIPSTPLPGVAETLETLQKTRHYRTIVITKGNMLDQENKLERSGLKKYFSHIEIVSDKTPEAYCRLLDFLGIESHELLMVGNSFKSDIAPVLTLGGYGVHIPFKTTWQHEKTDEFDHPHLFRISEFSELCKIL